jgi:hypothetical protein
MGRLSVILLLYLSTVQQVYGQDFSHLNNQAPKPLKVKADPSHVPREESQRFMNIAGWGDRTKFEDTHFLIKDLLIQMTTKDAKALAWLRNLNNYLSSESFKKKSLAKKQDDLREAKTYVKIAILNVLKIEY